MKHGHLTEQRKQFVEAYCRLGNGTLAAKEAGYKDSPSLVNQASKLKRELSSEIAEELTANFMSAAPKAFSILIDLAENSVSDSLVESRFELFCMILFLSGTKEVEKIINNATNIDKYWRGRKDSNPQPSDPKSDALSS